MSTATAKFFPIHRQAPLRPLTQPYPAIPAAKIPAKRAERSAVASVARMSLSEEQARVLLSLYTN